VEDEQLIGGRYRILREIASGGMGTVYEARHALSEKIVALKVLHAHVAHDAASHQRFLREVRTPAQIGHEGIVDVYDADIDQKNGTVFFAMELLDGETLRQRLARGHVPAAELFDIFAQLLDPLAAAHAKGIVHRDLKPENVFLCRRKGGGVLVKICDFGIVRDTGEESEKGVTQVGTAMGTPEYMSPEQATNARDVTAATDVWAIGVMLYETLGGRTPFTGASPTAIVVDMLTRPHQPLHSIAPGVPRALADLVDRCLSKAPTDRPPDARALAAELDKAAQSVILPPTQALDLSTMQAAGSTRAEELRTTPAGHGGAPTTPVGSVWGTPPASTPGAFGTAAPTAPGAHAAVVSHATGTGRSFASPAKPRSGMGIWPIAIGAIVVLGIVVAGALAALYGSGVLGASTGQLRVQTSIANAELFVDGSSRGPLSQGRVLELPTGRHVVEARAAGASLVTQSVDVQSGRLVDVVLDVPARRIAGSLMPGDGQLTSGEYRDDYSFQWPAQTNVHIEMRSQAFDTYLIVIHPDRPQTDVNDVAGQTDAVVDFTTGAGGTYRILATSARVGETGPYELVLQPPP
jgi:serine/threonine-protein kinase